MLRSHRQTDGLRSVVCFERNRLRRPIPEKRHIRGSVGFVGPHSDKTSRDLARTDRSLYAEKENSVNDFANKILLIRTNVCYQSGGIRLPSLGKQALFHVSQPMLGMTLRTLASQRPTIIALECGVDGNAGSQPTFPALAAL